MPDNRVRCTNCGRVLDSTDLRTVDGRHVVHCGRCPKRKYALSENDRKLLRGLKIKAD